MKTSTTRILFILALCIATVNWAHATVLSMSFEFSSQAQLDQFLINYPDATSIDGSISVNGTGIHNLDALQNVESIMGGDLYINVNNPLGGQFSFTGLASLTSISGNLWIYDNQTTPFITSLVGLQNLNSVQSITLANCRNLTSISEFDGITSLQGVSIEGGLGAGAQNLFNGLTNVQSINITEWNASDFVGFNSLISATAITFDGQGGGMEIDLFDSFHALESVNYLSFISCYINSFDGFEMLQTVVEMQLDNFSNGDMWSFDSLSTVGTLSLFGNANNGPIFPALTSIDAYLVSYLHANSIAFPALSSVGGDLLIYGNYEDTASPNLQSLDFSMLTSVGGMLNISHTALTNLDFLASLESVANSITLFNNGSLSSCNALVICERIASDPTSIYVELNMPGDCESVPAIAATCNSSFASGLIFADVACNGVFDTGDIALNNAIIHDQTNNPVGGVLFDGNYVVDLPDNSTTTLSASSILSGFVAPSPIAITTDNTDTYYPDMDFAFCPLPNSNDLSVYSFSSSDPVPGYPIAYTIVVQNLWTSTEDGQVIFNFSNMPGVSFVSAYEGTLNGTQCIFQVQDLPFMQTANFYVWLNIDPSTALGTVLQPSVSVSILPSAISDINPDNNYFNWSQVVVGSFDPNDISVHPSEVNIADIATDEGVVLDYLIRFQNTGTAPANVVRVEDIIEEDIDMSSIQMISASHPYNLNFLDNRRMEWVFDNIQLPDSSSDLEGSQGYIHFTAHSNNGMGLSNVIENQVSIFFDFNEPVITNVASTIFYTCPSEPAINEDLSFCESEFISLNASSGWDLYHWELDNVTSPQSSSNIDFGQIIPGNHELTLTVESPFCSSSINAIIDVTAEPITPVISQTGNVLTASGQGQFSWVFNGDVISNEPTLVITESGDYSVFSSLNGCDSPWASGNYIVSSIDKINSNARLTIYPNPASDELSVLWNASSTENARFEVINNTGQVVATGSIMSTGTYKLDISSLSSGAYVLKIGDEKIHFTKF